MNDWIEVGIKNNPSMRLIIVTTIPDKHLESFCQLYTFGMNQAPRAEGLGDQKLTSKAYRMREKRFLKENTTTETALVLDSSDKVIGMTELYFNGFIKNYLSQNLTTVVVEHRGQKIGKWLKASLLVHTSNKYPEVQFIRTGNALNNAPMLAINKQIGYEANKEWVDWQISFEELKGYVENNKKRIKNI